MNVKYSDFRLLCAVDDTEEWVPWLSVRGDGVYVKEPPAGLLASEAAALSDHPTGNLSEPALRFPCTLSELDLFLTEHGQHPCIDAFVMAKWVQAQAERRERPETPIGETEQPLPTKGAVSVTLPHLPKALAAVFEIMRNNWADYDSRRLPKQVNIAREIDEALGWKGQADGPSRNAKAIAVLIKPDAIDDTEQ